MDADQIVDLLSRWVHVGAAIVLLGGSTFVRFVLMPAAEQLPEAEHRQLRSGVMARWKRIVMIGIVLLLVTGGYNYYARDGKTSQYHMLMGIKMLLALGVFFLASALTGRSEGLAAVRRDAKKWLTVLIVLASVVVAIAGFLKVAVRAG
jgi:uncharacterized membrane protein